jgi:hypothetical protein
MDLRKYFTYTGFDANRSPPFLSFERVNWNYPTVAQKRPSFGVKNMPGNLYRGASKLVGM